MNEILNPQSKKAGMSAAMKTAMALLLSAVSAVAWYISYRMGLTTVYNDAMSHLNIARFVIDSQQPGLAQLGSVWLPLNHFLYLALIWNDWAWHSGFAGSIFSMIAYVASAIGVYAIVMELTGEMWASLAGAAAFALNPNMLYLQTTPLTEPVYVACAVLSFLFLIKFMRTDVLRWLLLAGLFSFLQVLARYDGWFVVCVEGAVLLAHQLFVKKTGFQEAIGKLLLIAVPVIFAVVLWLGWNQLIFGNALYFLYGPYSAHAQQAAIQSHTGLLTKGSAKWSFLAYWYSAVDNIGIWATAIGLIGVAAFFWMRRKVSSVTEKTLIVILLASPIIFNILALYLGFSILNVPELHWNPSGLPSGEWFNVRYGILALPFVAVFAGVLAGSISKKKIGGAIIAIAMLFQAGLIAHAGLITVTDGTIGSSAFVYDDIAHILNANVAPGENVLISLSYFSAVTFKSGLPLDSFIYEGLSKEWTPALQDPKDYAQWIVTSNGDDHEPVYDALIANPSASSSANFAKYYRVFYCDMSACVYTLRTPQQTYVTTAGTKIMVGDSQYSVKGVNDYDLAYQSPAAIDATLHDLHAVGVNTVRFWMFGDGNNDGFQPQSGIMSESRFENADYLIADAKNYDIRLIPVLLNNWDDYGGISQYLTWLGQDPANHDEFYSNPAAVNLFENYINHVVTRKNTVNGVEYRNDPTILAWEVVNEPRFDTTDTAAFTQWFTTVAAYLKQKDPNHLITMETESDLRDVPGQRDLLDECGLAVDICSAHLYAYEGTSTIFSNLADMQSAIKNYVAVAASHDKPFVIGEIGVSKATKPFGMQPLAVLSAVTKGDTGSGFLIWNFSKNPDTSYGFSAEGYQGKFTLGDLATLMGNQPNMPFVSALSTLPAAENTAIAFVASGPDSEHEDRSGATVSVATPSPANTSTQPLPPATVSILPQSSGATPIETIPTVAAAEPTGTLSGTTAPGAPAAPVSQPIAIANLLLPYSSNGFASSSWGSFWGASGIDGSTLAVSADPSNTSGGAFLTGSSAWQNYIFEADLNWTKGSTFSLFARYQDGNNNVFCQFHDDGEVDVIRTVNGSTDQIGQGDVIGFLPRNAVKAYVKVDDTHVTCSLDGSEIPDTEYQGLPTNLMNGGIGFETWDPTMNNSSITVNSVSVTQIP